MVSANINPPLIHRSVMLDLVGDCGQATFHKILSWLTQQFCDHAGPKSRTKIWSIPGGGSEAIPMGHEGEAELPRRQRDFRSLRANASLESALGTLPQRDRMILVVHPKFGVHSFEEIRNKKPAFKLASSADDGESFIGYVAMTLLAAHGLDQASLESWGGQVFCSKRPQLCFQSALDGTSDALIQEAIMLPEWNELVDRRGWIPIPVEAQALETLIKAQGKAGFDSADITSDHWVTSESGIQALDFSDFLLVIRDDMPDDVAGLLTWCLINTKAQFEDQFKHIPSDKCALTYPMDPLEMAKTSIPLHPAARKMYKKLGTCLEDVQNTRGCLYLCRTNDSLMN